MSEEWLERQEGPDGQYCDLLNRLPYDRERMVEQGMFKAESQLDGQDAVLRALAWSVSVKDALTGKTTNDLDRAAAEVIDPWRKRAVELYNAWYLVAFPGPKGLTPTESPPMPSTDPETSETSA